MSENRENSAPGDPVVEEPSNPTEVLEAARRAAGSEAAENDVIVAEVVRDEPVTVPDPAPDAETTELSTDAKRREEAALDDTQIDLEMPELGRVEIAEIEELPSAAAPVPPADRADTKALPHDGEVPLESMEQFAALYSQAPLPPEKRGNRGAGVLIALLATVAFAILYAGAIAALLLRHFPVETLFQEGVMPRLLTLDFAGAVLGFFVAQVILVMILGRANWWAYVIGGFFVGLAAWLGACVGGVLHDQFIDGKTVSWAWHSIVTTYSFQYITLATAVVGREVSLWFGVWTGTRGRRMKRANAEAMTEYEESLAEASTAKA